MANRSFAAHRLGTNVRFHSPLQWGAQQIFKILWFTAPRLAERLAVKLFFTPFCYPLPLEEKRRLDEGEPFRVRVHDKWIQAWR